MLTQAQLAAFAGQTRVEIEGTTFLIDRLPATEARKVWREMLHAMGESQLIEALRYIDLGGAADRESAIAVIRGILTLDIDFLERSQARMLASVKYQNPTTGREPIAVLGVEDVAFAGLDPVDVDELLVRMFAVNFFSSFRKIATKLQALAPEDQDEDAPPNR